MKHVLILLLCWSFSALGIAQNQIKEQKARANNFLYNTHYEEALNLFTKILKEEPKDKEIIFLVALCQYHTNQLRKAEASLKKLMDKNKVAFPEVLLYMGKIFHSRNEFQQAAYYYKKYLKSTKDDNPSRRAVIDDLRRCSNGMQLLFRDELAVVENMGSEINSALDEFAPIISPNHSDRIYFSAIRENNTGGKRDRRGRPDPVMGQYYSDMFSCENSGGNWQDLKLIANQLNTSQHEIIIDFNPSGSVMYYFSGSNLYEGEILKDTFNQGNEIRTDVFRSPLFSLAGDGTPFFANDTLLLFSSRRSGGYGGLDIYATFFKNKAWSAPVNLGPDVNTPYDETTPFLAKDGKTLYFSSNASNSSIGGFDVFKTIGDSTFTQWLSPYNLGLPINSAGDDTYFRLSPDGYTGFLSSSRKEGFGMRDLYIAYFNDYRFEMEGPKIKIVEQEDPLPPEVKAPSIFFPIQTEEDILSDQHTTILNNIQSILAENNSYIVLITGFSQQASSPNNRLFEAIELAEIASGYLTRTGVPESSIFIRGTDISDLNSTLGSQAFSSNGIVYRLINLENPPASISFFSEPSSAEVVPMLEYGDLLSEGLSYKIQFVSLRGKYKGKLLDKFSDPLVEKNDVLGIYRYTLGFYKDFNSAVEAKEQLRKAGAKSAFIVPYIYGIRASNEMVDRFLDTYPDLINMKTSP